MFVPPWSLLASKINFPTQISSTNHHVTTCNPRDISNVALRAFQFCNAQQLSLSNSPVSVEQGMWQKGVWRVEFLLLCATKAVEASGLEFTQINTMWWTQANVRKAISNSRAKRAREYARNDEVRWYSTVVANNKGGTHHHMFSRRTFNPHLLGSLQHWHCEVEVWT